MAKYGSDDVFLLVNGYDLSGDTIELSDNRETAIEETHGFGDEWVEVEGTGVKMGGITQRAFYDDANDATAEAYAANAGESQILCAGVEGNAAGRRATCFEGAIQRNSARQPERGLFHKIAAEFMSSGIIDDRATIIQHLEEHDASTTTEGSDSPHDNSAASNDGGRFYYQVTDVELDGATNIRVTVQHSSDNGVSDPWADIDGGPTVTAAPTAHMGTVAAGTTIERYVRVRIFPTGAAGTDTAITLLVAAARD